MSDDQFLNAIALAMLILAAVLTFPRDRSRR